MLILLAVLLAMFSLTEGKPIYDFRSSYVTQLTNFNFKDQVTKIRQNTNYVAVVQFYKYNGKSMLIQMANHCPLLKNSMNGFMNITESSGSEQLIAMSTPNSALMRA